MIIKAKNSWIYSNLPICIMLIFLLGCDKDDPIEIPSISTIEVTEITRNSAKSGGNITSDGGAEIIARGVVWSTSEDPDIDINEGYTTDGDGMDEFISILSELSPGTTYFVRAYAENSAGIVYGNQIEFETLFHIPGGGVTDIDGNTYPTVIIGEQEWMAENLKVTRYTNGTNIPLKEVNMQWRDASPAYCWYDNDYDNYGSTYGVLYNWYALDPASNGGNNICPAGWHLPTLDEWEEMAFYLHANGYNYDGSTHGTWETNNKYGKSLAATTNWMSTSTQGAIGNTDYPEKRNFTGFSALPGGFRNADGSFLFIRYEGLWWSATVNYQDNVYYVEMSYFDSIVGILSKNMNHGLSVRCIKD